MKEESMFASKKLAILVVLVMIAPIVLAACGATPEPETIIQTVVVEQTKIVVEEGEEVTIIETVEVEVEVPVEVPVEVEVTAVPEEAAPEEEAAEGETGPYRIALFEDPVTTNYWNYYGPGSSVWTSYIVDGQAPPAIPAFGRDLPGGAVPGHRAARAGGQRRRYLDRDHSHGAGCRVERRRADHGQRLSVHVQCLQGPAVDP
jgi:hypothetical protein